MLCSNELRQILKLNTNNFTSLSDYNNFLNHFKRLHFINILVILVGSLCLRTIHSPYPPSPVIVDSINVQKFFWFKKLLILKVSQAKANRPYSKMATILIVFVRIRISPSYLVLKLQNQKNILPWTRQEGLSWMQTRNIMDAITE